MTSQNENPNAGNRQQSKHEGGRKFGHVHEPTQAQQASRNEGLAASEQRQPGPRPNSQRNKPPGSSEPMQKHDQERERSSDKKSA